MIVIKAVRGYITWLRKISEHKRLGTRWRYCNEASAQAIADYNQALQLALMMV